MIRMNVANLHVLESVFIVVSFLILSFVLDFRTKQKCKSIIEDIVTIIDKFETYTLGGYFDISSIFLL